MKTTRNTLTTTVAAVAVLAVAESLKADDQVEFTAQEPKGESGWDEHADTLFDEMEAAEFTAGDLVQLCTFVCRLSNLTGDHLREVESSFSSVATEESG